MENQQSPHFTIKASNTMKIKVLFFIAAVYVWLWWMNFYSDRFFSLAITLNTLTIITFYLEIRSQNYGQLLRGIYLGIIPAIITLYIPKYFVIALCAHFICINFGFDELNWNYIPYLFGSNTIGWIITLYYYHVQRDSGLQILSSMMIETNFFYQILTGFVINYLVIGVIAINKFTASQLKKKYELKLEKLNTDLEDANDKLKKSNRELQDALQEKENFILRFSHEIRNPLNSLLGNVELCYEHTADEDSKTMLKDAQVSGEILLQLLNNVLDAAKVSAGRLEVSVNTQNIRGFLENVWVICSEIIRKKRLYGCFSVNVNVPNLLEFDHHRVIQILINTISNAAKYTDTGHVKLFVDFIEGNQIRNEDMRPKFFVLPSNEQDGWEVTPEEEISENPKEIFETLSLNCKKFRLDQAGLLKHAQKEIQIPSSNEKGKFKSVQQGLIPNILARNTSGRFPGLSPPAKDGYIRLEIVDSGCGIAEKDLENVFGKFKQVSGTSSKRQIGTGLGLWITKEIVELMKGKIEIYSKAGKGSALVIMFKSKSSYLPLRQTLPHFYEQQQTAERVSTTNPDITKVKRVLVVEDIPYNQEINRRLLEKCGIKDITISSNGKEAVDTYLSKKMGHFDLVLMDIDMPVVDGKTAVKIIRQEERRRNWIPARIVFLTGYAEAKTQQELLDRKGDYRADGFYSKPASLLTIQRMLDEISDLQYSYSNSNIVIQSQRAASPDLSGGFENIKGKSQSILIVDDDSFNLEMLSKMLKLSKYNTIEARNGEEAIELYEQHWRDIELILMDCEMPVLDGLEATRRILSKHRLKATFSNKKLRIIGLTGHVGIEFKQNCLQAGMNDVLEKPIKMESLNAILKKN